MSAKVLRYAVFLPEILVTKRGRGKPLLYRKCVGIARVRKVKKT